MDSRASEFVCEASGLRSWVTPDAAPGATGDGGFAAEVLFTNLVCVEAVCVGRCECDLRRLVDDPARSACVRDLRRHQGNVDLAHMRAGYDCSQQMTDPSRIVPMGPLRDFDAAHDQARLGDTRVLGAA